MLLFTIIYVTIYHIFYYNQLSSYIKLYKIIFYTHTLLSYEHN